MKMTMSLLGAFVAALAFADTVEEVDEIALDADLEVNVPAGVTRNVRRLTGGAHTLVKTGAGVLNVYWVRNEDAAIEVSDGVFALRPYPVPAAVFAKAHFHVDASDLSSLELECVNGTNFVNRWNDTDGGTCYATNSPKTSIGRTDPVKTRRPFLRPNFQNGLPVVDFGSLLTRAYTNESGIALGYGAAMNWSERMDNTFREGFTVFSDTDDIFDAERGAIGGYAMAPFASFLRTANFRTVLPNARFFENTTYSLPLGRGTNVLDLTDTILPMGGYGRSPGRGFHILDGITTSAYIGTQYAYYFVDSFAAQLASNTAEPSFGGQRIAEYAVFDEYLSAKEREDVSLYLKTKWFPRRFASVTVRTGAAFEAGEAGVECGTFHDESGAKVAFGRLPLVIDPIYDAGAFFHLDAARADTLDLVSVNGTNFVAKWSEAAGGTAYATNMADEAPMPFVNPTETLNGLPFVDFGTLRTPYNTNDVGEALGYGAGLKFSASQNAAEGVIVVSDSPDVSGGLWSSCPDFTSMYGMSFFCHKTQNWRGRRGKLRAGLPPLVYANDGNNNPYSNGTNIMDGVLLTATRSTDYPTAGFHVFVSAPKGSETYGTWTHLAADSTGSCGGQRIAEYLLFKRTQTDDERNRLYQALRSKWFGESNPRVHSYASLSIPDGGVFDVRYEGVEVVGTLELGGKLAAPSVAATTVIVSSSSAAAEGPLTLGANATLRFQRLPDGSFTSLAATSLVAENGCTMEVTASDWSHLGGKTVRLVRGSVSGGPFTVKCNNDKIQPRVTVDAEGVSVSFVRGLMILFR